MIIDVMDREAMLRFVQSVKATPEGTLKAIEQMRLFREVESAAEQEFGVTPFSAVGEHFVAMLGYSREAIDAAVKILDKQEKPNPKRKRRSKTEIEAANVAQSVPVPAVGNPALTPPPETPEQKLSRLTKEAADRRAPVTADPLATQVVDPAVMAPPPPPPPAMLPDGGIVKTEPLPDLGDE